MLVVNGFIELQSLTSVQYRFYPVSPEHLLQYFATGLDLRPSRPIKLPWPIPFGTKSPLLFPCIINCDSNLIDGDAFCLDRHGVFVELLHSESRPGVFHSSIAFIGADSGTKSDIDETLIGSFAIRTGFLKYVSRDNAVYFLEADWTDRPGPASPWIPFAVSGATFFSELKSACTSSPDEYSSHNCPDEYCVRAHLLVSKKDVGGSSLGSVGVFVYHKDYVDKILWCKQLPNK